MTTTEDHIPKPRTAHARRRARRVAKQERRARRNLRAAQAGWVRRSAERFLDKQELRLVSRAWEVPGWSGWGDWGDWMDLPSRAADRLRVWVAAGQGVDVAQEAAVEAVEAERAGDARGAAQLRMLEQAMGRWEKLARL